eukprot:jgi/Botrbrau1/20019/Bobra.200_1s0025.1
MSGGIAYVYDAQGDFDRWVHHDVKDALVRDLTDKDGETLMKLIKRHQELTGSLLAARLLDNWQQDKRKFVKVFPLEYRKALAVGRGHVSRRRKPKRRIVPWRWTRCWVDSLDAMALLKKQMQAITQKHARAGTPSPLGDPELDQQRLKAMADQGMWVPRECPTRGRASGRERFLSATPRRREASLKYKREAVHYRDALERLEDYGEASRCMNCGTPFCMGDLPNTKGCPLGNKIPEWNKFVSEGRFDEALEALLQTNPFPEFTGFVCPAPCETSCTLGINQPAVAIKSMEISIAMTGWEKGWMKANPPQRRSRRRVAVVGSGPAGLAAAHDLNKAGHEVTVFEANDRCGGLVMYGIPNMKIEKHLVQRRLDLLAEEGITFVTNARVGEAAGTAPRECISPWSSWRANTRSLLNSNLQDGNFISAKGKKVVVIGGGDTGTDCIATSIRHGATQVVNLELFGEPPAARLPNNPWPQWSRIKRTDYGHSEAFAKFGKDPRVYNTETLQVVHDPQGNLAGLRVHKVRQHFQDGKMSFVQVEGTEEEFIEADLILLAMGFLGPRTDVANMLGVEVERNNYKANGPDMFGVFNGHKTNVEGVFAAGDCRSGQSLVVKAIAEGKSAARAVDAYLHPYDLSEDVPHHAGGFLTLEGYKKQEGRLPAPAA